MSFFMRQQAIWLLGPLDSFPVRAQDRSCTNKMIGPPKSGMIGA